MGIGSFINSAASDKHRENSCIGRIIAAFGTVFFGLFTKVGDYRAALLYAGFLFLPAAGAAIFLPRPDAAAEDK